MSPLRITENLAEVLARVERAALAAQRAPGDVTLVAVSKSKPASAIREAYAAGQRDFGENYAQELAEKAEELADLGHLRWHFIGHLQSNKAKLVVRAASVVHAVDSPSLARELGKRAARDRAGALPVLVEVNVGSEPQKHGVPSEGLAGLLDAVAAQPFLTLRGLMTMPARDLDAARAAFEKLVSLREANGGPARLPELSMGMSEDLDIAIACGATMVRVGSAIFGART